MNDKTFLMRAIICFFYFLLTSMTVSLVMAQMRENKTIKNAVSIVEPPSWYVEMQRNRLTNRKAQSGMKVVNLDEKLLKAIRNARLQSLEDILKTAESTLQVVNQIPKSITDLLSKRCQIDSQLCRDSYESFRSCQGHPMQEIDCVEMFDQLGGGRNCGDLLNCLASETGASDMMDE